MKNYYDILEVNENASQEVIERVYKLLAKKYHPDLNPDNSQEAEEKFKEISEAYEVLSDENSRRSYDEKLKTERRNASVTTNTSINYSNSNSRVEEDIPINMNNDEDINIDEAINDLVDDEPGDFQRQMEQQIEKAYNDAYVEAMKSYGFEVVYKKSFAERVQEIVCILLTIIFLSLFVLICWHIPFIRAYLEDLIGDLSSYMHL